MPVNPALAVTIPADSSLYRITAVSFHTPNTAHYKKVVNGMDARTRARRARGTAPGDMPSFENQACPRAPPSLQQAGGR
jgi:hypothetical protein